MGRRYGDAQSKLNLKILIGNGVDLLLLLGLFGFFGSFGFFEFHVLVLFFGFRRRHFYGIDFTQFDGPHQSF